jgi:hypothetical protein
MASKEEIEAAVDAIQKTLDKYGIDEYELATAALEAAERVRTEWPRMPPRRVIETPICTASATNALIHPDRSYELATAALEAAERVRTEWPRMPPRRVIETPICTASATNALIRPDRPE